MAYGNPGLPDSAVHGDSFEAAATLQLGRLLVGWSRLELAVEVYVSALPSTAAGAGLEKLFAHADTLADKALRAEFVRWISAMREAEPLGAALRGGRWLPDPRRNVVLLLGRPEAPGVHRQSYKLEELEAALARQKALLAGIHRLCMMERGLAADRAAAFLNTQPIDVVERAS